MILFNLIFKAVERFRNSHQKKRILYKLYHGFLYWRKLAFLKKIIHFNKTRKNTGLMKKTFHNWKNNLCLAKRYAIFQKKRSDKLIFLYFLKLKKYIGVKESKQKAKVKKIIYILR